eukprot:TRINITY_DN4512_c0_g1_i1.p1 TRINITY_DN4512_c0_g1~~TRINITY_DN4512_c0_g1_i1.p1  ORF type:complete len:310 (-),score=38.98 TRINITY_DN4512_c0_g1_i1:279-1208(-)
MRVSYLLISSILLHGVVQTCDLRDIDNFLDRRGQKRKHVIFQGVVENKVSSLICENGNTKLIKSGGRGINSNTEDDVALVVVKCESQGEISCLQGKEGSKECQVYITGLKQLAELNCGDVPHINKNYIIDAVPDDNFKGCRGVYQAREVVSKNTPIQKDSQGKCLKQENSLKVQRRLLQEDEGNSTRAQCGLFGVDITYCAPEGLVTDQTSAKIVMSCDNPVTGICSECLKVEGPQNGTVRYVIPIQETGNHHEIKISWESNYLGAVTLSTDECDLVDTRIQQMISPITPMKFTRVPFVMVRPSGYAVN